MCKFIDRTAAEAESIDCVKLSISKGAARLDFVSVYRCIQSEKDTQEDRTQNKYCSLTPKRCSEEIISKFFVLTINQLKDHFDQGGLKKYTPNSTDFCQLLDHFLWILM